MEKFLKIQESLICPSKESEKLIKMTGGQKWYNGKRDKEEKKDAIIK